MAKKKAAKKKAAPKAAPKKKAKAKRKARKPAANHAKIPGMKLREGQNNEFPEIDIEDMPNAAEARRSKKDGGTGELLERKYHSQGERRNFERLRRANIAGRLYHEGYSLADICEETGWTWDSCRNAIALARKAWAKRCGMDYEAAKAEALSRIDKIEAAAWQAWHASLRDTKKIECNRGMSGDNYVDTVKRQRITNSGPPRNVAQTPENKDRCNGWTGIGFPRNARTLDPRRA